jgi:antitoxin (DNA-binding transcriptional repressor) of toxin-antitoxin stability system
VLGYLDRIESHELARVTITQHGHVVAVLLPPEDAAAQVAQLHGFMRGSVVIPPDIDLTAPVIDEAFPSVAGDPAK